MATALKRKTTVDPKSSPAATGRFSSSSDALFEANGEVHHQPPSRLSRKTKPLHAQILDALEEYGPLCLAELIHVLDLPRNTAALKPHLRTLMHSEKVVAALELSRTYHERLVFILAEKAPSGIWDRRPIKGFERKGNAYRRLPEHELPRQRKEEPPPPKSSEKDDEREELALEMMKQAMALMKSKRGD